MSFLLMFCLYFSSFAPLWVSIFFVDAMSIIKGNTYIYAEIISMGLILAGGLVSFWGLSFFLGKKTRDGVRKYTIKRAHKEKTITTVYLLSYVLPLFAFDFTRWEEVFLFLIFFVTFGVLSFYHKNFSANIILELIHYSVYDCDVTNSDGISTCLKVLGRSELNGKITEEIELRPMNNDFYLEV